MVTEQHHVRRGSATGTDEQWTGVADRFRPLGPPDPTGAAQPGPRPEFTPSLWGYNRSEVDAWFSWTADLVAHGRNETVRADSAEATLRAALARLEQVQHGAAPPVASTGPSIRPVPPDPSEPAPSGPTTRAARPDAPTPAAASTGATSTAGDLPRRKGRTRSEGCVPAACDDPARMEIVDSTLREVMALLHRLVGPDR